MAERGRPFRLKADPELEVELGVCHHYRISHSEFLHWDQDDRDKAIWMWLQERQTCSQCGTRPSEWLPDQGGHRRAYLAEVEVCRGCQAIDQRSKGIAEGNRQPGMQIVLKPNPNAKEAAPRGES